MTVQIGRCIQRLSKANSWLTPVDVHREVEGQNGNSTCVKTIRLRLRQFILYGGL